MEVNHDLRQRLEAAKQTVLSERIRRLLGKEKALLEEGNVYGQKLPKEEFDKLLGASLEDEYIKNWISLMTKEKPMSVEEIDAVIKLGAKSISTHLVELWNRGRASLYGFEENNAKFISSI